MMAVMHSDAGNIVQGWGLAGPFDTNHPGRQAAYPTVSQECGIYAIPCWTCTNCFVEGHKGVDEMKR
jgi:hypothetical protein